MRAIYRGEDTTVAIIKPAKTGASIIEIARLT
jgi:hypothetical protein